MAGRSRLLEFARSAYRELTPGASIEQAEAAVTGAADAMFVVVLERIELVGDAVHARLPDHVGSGLAAGGSRSQIVLHEPYPLSAEPRSGCLRDADVFALPDGGNR